MTDGKDQPAAADAHDDDVRVLVVDDYPDAAELLAEILTINGYAVRVAHDGREALAVVETFAPHCVILDVNMPDIDGNELSTRLRQRYGDDIVLIAISGAEREDPSVMQTFDRVDHYLRKPLDPAALARALPPLGRGAALRPLAAP